MINNRQFAVIHLNYDLEQKPQKLTLDYNMFMDDSIRVMPIMQPLN